MVAKISYRDFCHGCSVSRVRQSCLPKRRWEQDKDKEAEPAAKWQWHGRRVRVTVIWLSHSRRSDSGWAERPTMRTTPSWLKVTRFPCICAGHGRSSPPYDGATRRFELTA